MLLENQYWDILFRSPSLKLLFIQLCLSRQILYSCQNVGVQGVVADVVGGTVGMLETILAVGGIDKAAERLAIALARAKAHRPAAVGTFHKTEENLRGRDIFDFPAPIGGLFMTR